MTDRILADLHGIKAAIDAMARRPTVKVAFVSVQAEQFCSHRLDRLEFQGVVFDVLPDLAALQGRAAAYDICILCCHNNEEEPVLFDLRASGFAALYFAWLWDNHHHPIETLRTALLADCVFVSHWHERDYLNHPLVFPGPHIPACARQFSAGLIQATYPAGLPVDRADGLFGGFGRYPWTTERNDFIKALMAACPDHALTLGSLPAYAALPERLRLERWASHKVQVTVPIAGDLSTRVFEALMTGQIPLVPSDVADLDLVVPPALQASLPILRYAPRSIDSVKQSWQEGLRRFDAEGAVGVARRHAYARDYHGLDNRLARFAEFIRAPGHFELSGDHRRRFWSNWQPPRRR
jgi:hypothetical protein